MLARSSSSSLRWQRPYSTLGRQIDIFAATAQFIFYLWWDRFWQNTTPMQRRQRARWLVKTLLNLGPTFIKVGQALSTRADLIPVEYTEELGQLQDRVPPFASEAAIATIERELQQPLPALYRDFDPFPIAAASLGQVHKARLHTGEDVVVKVQRPGLDRLFKIDAKSLREVIQFGERYFSWMRKYNLMAIYKEFFSILIQEIDYTKEAENADRFRENFKDDRDVIIPKVYWQYTTPKVLTIEYKPGIKIDDIASLTALGINPEKLNQIGICCYLKQLLLDGFFQADPHPGNMAVNPEGQIIFYDFGMMVEVQSLTQGSMVEAFFSILRKDTEAILKALMEMGLIEPVSDMRPVRRLLDFLLERFTERPVNIEEFNEIKDELYLMFKEQPFRLPAQMTFVLRALTTLDGIARTLDPRYNFLAAARPFVRDVTLSQNRGSAIVQLAKQTTSYLKYKLQQPSRTERLIHHLERRIELGELQVRVRTLETDRALERIYLAVKSLVYVCLTGFALLAGALLLVGELVVWAIVTFVFAGASLLVLLRSLLRLNLQEKLDKLADK